MALDQHKDEEEEGGMSFLDHLEALRWHLLRAVSAVLFFSVAAFIAKDFVFGVLILGPSKVDFWTYRVLCDLGNYLGIEALCIDQLPFTIQSRQMTGQFSMHMTSSLVVGLIAAFPYLFWEVWRFISPGLYDKEKGAARGAVAFVSFLFLSGAVFGYYVLTPMSINFLANYQLDASIANEFDITSYVSTLTMLVLASAIMFQLPVVVYFWFGDFQDVKNVSETLHRNYLNCFGNYYSPRCGQPAVDCHAYLGTVRGGDTHRQAFGETKSA